MKILVDIFLKPAIFVAIFLFRRATSHYLQLTKRCSAFHCRNRSTNDLSWQGLSYIVKKIYRNQETDEVLKHFRFRYGLILVFCNNKTLIVQQILGLALFSIQQTDLTSFSQDRRGVKLWRVISANINV
jgi:hypothetical protein